MQQIYSKPPAKNAAITFLPVSFLPVSFLIGAIFVTAGSAMAAEKNQNDQVIETLLVIGQPLNKSFEANAGAFGAKDLLEIPIVIQSISADTIANTSARTAIDVLSFDSSILSASYGGSFDNYRLRGFPMDNFNTVRRDGLSLAPHHDFGLENIERIDVLKGPSGFLYGFNSPGGTINYLVKRPTNDPFLNLSLQGTSLEGRYAAADASASLADEKFGYRVNLAYEKNGDFNHARDMERNLASIATDFRLSERALLQVNADWSSKSATADPLLRADQSARTDPLNPDSYILPPTIDRRDLLTGSWYRHDTRGANIEMKLELTLDDGWMWISQGNYSRVTRHGGYTDLFYIQPNGDIGYADLYNSRGEIFSVASLQTYLAGTFSTGSLHHDVFVGASTKEFEDESPFWDFVESAGDIGIERISVVNVLNPVQPPRWDFGPKQPIEYRATIKEHSIFASDLLSITDEIQLLLGGRFIAYRAKELSAVALPQEKDVFVPTGAFMFHPTDKTMAYVSYSRGFEKGDYAPFYANNANQPTDTIESEQYETGFKIKISNDVSAGIAIFDIRRNASYVNLNNDFVSDGEYNHRGIEVNLTGEIAQGFSLAANAAYLSTELNDVVDPSTLGKRSEGVPAWNAGIRAGYTLTSLPGLSIDGTISYVGSRPIDAQNSGFIPGYTLFNAGISYQWKWDDTPVKLRLYGNNLTDKYYYASTFYQGGLEVGKTRELFLSAHIEF
ncbi:MAG: fcuA 1 [Cellvibrio sp.]|nr:fcuA 1 [Cellvibrio sp.]